MKHTKALVLVAAILIFLIIISVLVTFMTQNILRKRQGGALSLPALSTISPTPAEKSVYFDLPNDFPRDFPLPTAVKVTVGNESETDWTGVFLTQEPIENISSFYLRELPNTGWKITNESSGGGLFIIYTEKEKREAIVAIGRGDEGITVSVTILKGS